MLDTLVFADQPRAGDRPVILANAPNLGLAAVEPLAQRLQPLNGLGLEAAMGQLLDPVGQPALQVGSAERRRLGAEQLPPLRLQVGGGSGLEGGELGEDGGGLQACTARSEALSCYGHAFLWRDGFA